MESSSKNINIGIIIGKLKIDIKALLDLAFEAIALTRVITPLKPKQPNKIDTQNKFDFMSTSSTKILRQQ